MFENVINISKQPQQNKENRRKINWDLQNAFSNYFHMLFSQIGLAAFSFLITYLLTQRLGIENYGQISAFISAAQLVQISIWWTANALGRYGVEEYVKTNQITHSFWTRTLLFLLNVVVVLMSAFIWYPLIATAFKLPMQYFLVFLIFLTVGSISMHFTFALQASKLLKSQTFLQMLEKVIGFGVLFILYYRNSFTTDLALWVLALSPIVTILLSVILLRRIIDWNPLKANISVDRVKRFLYFSLPIPLNSLLSPLALNYVGTLFILYFHSKTDLGLYAIANQFNGLILMLPTVLGSLVMPLFVTADAENKENALQTEFFRGVLPLATLVIGFVAIVFTLAVHIFLPLYGDQYAGVSKILWILAAGGAAAAPVLMGYFPFFISRSNTYIILFASGCAAFVLVGVSFLLVPRYGTIGSSWAMVLSLVANLVVYDSATCHRLSLGFPRMLLITIPSIVGAFFVSLGFDFYVCALVSLVGIVILFRTGQMTYLRAFATLKSKFHGNAT